MEHLLFDQVCASADEFCGGQTIAEGSAEGFRDTPLMMILKRTVQPPAVTVVTLLPAKYAPAEILHVEAKGSGLVAERGVSYNDSSIYRQPGDVQVSNALAGATMELAAPGGVLEAIARNLDVFQPYDA